MIKVYVKKQSNYPVSTPKIKRKLAEFLKSKGIVSDADVSVIIVGKSAMMNLSKKYLNESGVIHNVLSFPFNEAKEDFIAPPDNKIHLGEIIICYPKAQEEANNEQKLTDDKVYELIEHGALHLMGEHHE